MIEDEIHFITTCNNYNIERQQMYTRLSAISGLGNFKELDNETKCITLFNSDQRHILMALTTFIKSALIKRKDILHTELKYVH